MRFQLGALGCHDGTSFIGFFILFYFFFLINMYVYIFKHDQRMGNSEGLLPDTPSLR